MENLILNLIFGLLTLATISAVVLLTIDAINSK
jgi:hypothetical protein